MSDDDRHAPVELGVYHSERRKYGSVLFYCEVCEPNWRDLEDPVMPGVHVTISAARSRASQSGQTFLCRECAVKLALAILDAADKAT